MDTFRFSSLADKLKSNVIRELLKLTSKPGMISFGGGVPDPETFPVKDLSVIAQEVISNEYRYALQYGSTEGDEILREAYINFLKNNDDIDGINLENIMISVGSQSALELVAKVFLDENSTFFVTKPVYLGAASAFRLRCDNYEYISLREDGVDLKEFETRLEELKSKGKLGSVKFLYVVSNFQNPAGITMTLENRKELLKIAEKYDILIIEDDPYGDLRYDGESVPSIYKLGGKERVLLLKTFSKILSPGMRLGFIIGHEEVIRKLVMAKQATDLCTPSLTQRIAARYLERHDIKKHLVPTIALYKKKKDLMLKELDKHFGDIEGVSWTKPEGGLFLWMDLPEEFNTFEMLDIAKKNNVLFVPGSSFSLNNSCLNSMRLSFCLPPEEDIIEGVKRLKDTYIEYAKSKGLL